MIRFYNCLFNILHKYVYVGVDKLISPNEYARMHTIVIMSFTIMLNLLLIKRYLNISFGSDFVWNSFIVLGFVVFIVHYFFIYPRLVIEESSLLMKILTLGYIIISLLLMVL